MPVVKGAEIKVVGRNGQIALGKAYAGKALRVERREDGSILLTPVAMVPENQLWTLEPQHRSRIERGLAWAARAEPAETDLDDLAKRQPKPRGHRRDRRR